MRLATEPSFCATISFADRSGAVGYEPVLSRRRARPGLWPPYAGSDSGLPEPKISATGNATGMCYAQKYAHAVTIAWSSALAEPRITSGAFVHLYDTYTAADLAATLCGPCGLSTEGAT